MVHVLVADDQPDSAELLEVLLQFLGYRVTRVQDGEAALRRARETAPDLLLLDEIMPGMNGSDVCRALRSDPATAACIVVLFSSCDEQDVPWRAAGAAAFLRKPLAIPKLRAFLENLLVGRGPAGEAGRRTAVRDGNIERRTPLSAA
jgi:CheY-like chemotaxis protein